MIELVPIFAENEEGISPLYTVRLDKNKKTEWEKLRAVMCNRQNLREFFRNNLPIKTYPLLENCEPRHAERLTQEGFQDFEFTLYYTAKAPEDERIDKLNELFTPIHNQEKEVAKRLKQSKAKPEKCRWVRVFALKVNNTCFIIAGGGIKPGEAIQDDTYLDNELDKLKQIRRKLIASGFSSKQDIKYFEAK